MITLDQVYLLEQKVESAVAKIQQLQADNDALRKKCAELTNALSSKSEQLNSFESDQTQIENGIKKALDRLSLIENSLLKAAGQGLPVQPVQTPQPVVTKPVETTTFVAAPITSTPVETPEAEINLNDSLPSFDTMETISVSEDDTSESEKQLEETLNWDESVSEEQAPSFGFDEIPEQTDDSSMDSEDNSDELGFDIF